jgi:hypothetical protein
MVFIFASVKLAFAAGKKLDLEEKKAIADTILRGIEIVQGIGRAVGTAMVK